MATRTQAREAVVSVLYSVDMGNFDAINHIDRILEEKKIRNKQREFVLELYQGVKSNLASIDKIMQSFTKDGFDKIGMVEKSILRLAIYEMKFSSIDKVIAINEAVEVAKKLTSDNSPGFINGVLESVKNS